MIYRACFKQDEYVWMMDEDIDACARHGMEMRKTSKARGHRDTKGLVIKNETDAVRMQALGAVCEGAICTLFGWPLRHLKSETYSVADLPGNLQVRLIGHEHYGLRVYPSDDPSWRVVGVVVLKNCERQPYRFPGWFYAGEALQHPEWFMAPHGRPPMCAVPQDHLHSMRELRELLASEGIATTPLFKGEVIGTPVKQQAVA